MKKSTSMSFKILVSHLRSSFLSLFSLATLRPAVGPCHQTVFNQGRTITHQGESNLMRNQDVLCQNPSARNTCVMINHGICTTIRKCDLLQEFERQTCIRHSFRSSDCPLDNFQAGFRTFDPKYSPPFPFRDSVQSTVDLLGSQRRPPLHFCI